MKSIFESSNLKKNGFLSALIFGVLWAWFGFWKAVAICLLAGFGYVVGYIIETYQQEEKESDDLNP
jgi:uncharacterized membrane protein